MLADRHADIANADKADGLHCILLQVVGRLVSTGIKAWRYFTDMPSAKLSVTVMEPSTKTHSWIAKLRSPFGKTAPLLHSAVPRPLSRC
jgi:hypothetical protein